MLHMTLIGECLIWKSAVDGEGYPLVKIAGKTHRFTRYIFAHLFGPLTKDIVLRHTCDQPRCVSPYHLILGTHADNVKDRVDRGRSAVGEGNGRAKLTEADVLSIRATAGTHQSLAEIYGVDRKVISRIKAGKAWRSLLPPTDTP